MLSGNKENRLTEENSLSGYSCSYASDRPVTVLLMTMLAGKSSILHLAVADSLAQADGVSVFVDCTKLENAALREFPAELKDECAFATINQDGFNPQVRIPEGGKKIIYFSVPEENNPQAFLAILQSIKKLSETTKINYVLFDEFERCSSKANLDSLMDYIIDVYRSQKIVLATQPNERIESFVASIPILHSVIANQTTADYLEKHLRREADVLRALQAIFPRAQLFVVPDSPHCPYDWENALFSKSERTIKDVSELVCRCISRKATVAVHESMSERQKLFFNKHRAYVGQK